uniref:BZIP domain-containing protein n=1 Tax=Ascaris lumbricoides TaxID=6252 RepID=A0A0M3HMT7_ASCLU
MAAENKCGVVIAVMPCAAMVTAQQRLKRINYRRTYGARAFHVAIASQFDVALWRCQSMMHTSVHTEAHLVRTRTRRPLRVVFVETNDGICNDFLIFPNVIQNSSLYAPQTPTYITDEYGGAGDEQQLSGRNSEYEGSVRGHSPEQIFEEIVRECEEIERRSSSSPTDSSLSKGYNFFIELLAQTFQDHPPLAISRVSEKKKAQNRAAATRYRERKKRERELAKQNVLELETYNAMLRARVTEIQKEISYLHNLMEEVRSRSC